MEFRGVLEIIKRAKDKWDMHIEIITNLIPDINDDENGLRIRTVPGVEDFSSDDLIIRFWNIKLTEIDAGFAVK